MSVDVLGVLRQAGFKGPALRTAWAIVNRESKGDPRAYNPDSSTGDLSYGLFQVNMLGRMGADRRRMFGLASNEDLFDPTTNARVAYSMSKGGRDFGAWGVGPNAYRRTAPLDFSGYPGSKPSSAPPQSLAGPRTATAAPPVPPAAPATRPMGMKTLNQLARQFGFKSFAQAYGMTPKQAKEFARTSIAVPSPRNPQRLAFKATPPPARQTKPLSADVKGGVAELFYDPAGRREQWDQGNWINPIGGHSDHVHVSFSSPQAAIRLIRVAQDMGLRVGENPYVDPVDPSVHVTTSFHKRLFPGSYDGRQLGEAIDVSGPASLMMRFYQAARAYVSAA